MQARGAFVGGRGWYASDQALVFYKEHTALNVHPTRFGPAAIAALLLAACGATPQPAAIVETCVVTQVVTRVAEVTREVTREVVVTATPRPATPTAPPEPTATSLPTSGKWQLDAGGASSFDDSESVVLALDAEQEISGQFDTKLPTLILRCQERQLEAYVVTGLQPDVEPGNLVTGYGLREQHFGPDDRLG